MNMFLISPKFV